MQVPFLQDKWNITLMMNVDWVQPFLRGSHDEGAKIQRKVDRLRRLELAREKSKRFFSGFQVLQSNGKVSNSVSGSLQPFSFR